jgi:hypothetical protein
MKKVIGMMALMATSAAVMVTPALARDNEHTVVPETHFTAVRAQNRRDVDPIQYRRDHDRNVRPVVVYRNDAACVR